MFSKEVTKAVLGGRGQAAQGPGGQRRPQVVAGAASRLEGGASVPPAAKKRIERKIAWVFSEHRYLFVRHHLTTSP